MCLRERHKLRYQRLFWLHLPEVYTEGLYTVTYRLLAPKSRVNLVFVYFPRMRLVHDQLPSSGFLILDWHTLFELRGYLRDRGVP